MYSICRAAAGIGASCDKSIGTGFERLARRSHQRELGAGVAARGAARLAVLAVADAHRERARLHLRGVGAG